MLGMIVLTSLMTLAFWEASICVKVRLNAVFSFGFSGSALLSLAAAALSPLGWPLPEAACTGIATSVIFSLDYQERSDRRLSQSLFVHVAHFFALRLLPNFLEI
jgi:hypothetical protein